MSLGSMVGCVASPGWMLLYGAPMAAVIMSGVMAVLVVYKHRENIARLMAGQEHVWR